MISGIFGGLLPILQSIITDTTTNRTKYLGRIMAYFGIGFFLGNIIQNFLLYFINIKKKIFITSFFPLLSFILIYLYGIETINIKKNKQKIKNKQKDINNINNYIINDNKNNNNNSNNELELEEGKLKNRTKTTANSSTLTSPNLQSNSSSILTYNSPSSSTATSATSSIAGRNTSTVSTYIYSFFSYFKLFFSSSSSSTTTTNSSSSSLTPPPSSTIFFLSLLLFNSFTVMYAFSIESIYSIFLKDTYGYEESSLSLLMIFSGILIGLIHLLILPYLLNFFSSYSLLFLSNILLLIGLIGISFIRKKVFHFFFFFLHLIGYGLSDLLILLLLTLYTSNHSYGIILGLNQFIQASAKIIGPILNGLLYDFNKEIIEEKKKDKENIEDDTIKDENEDNDESYFIKIISNNSVGFLPFICSSILTLFILLLYSFRIFFMKENLRMMEKNESDIEMKENRMKNIEEGEDEEGEDEDEEDQQFNQEEEEEQEIEEDEEGENVKLLNRKGKRKKKVDEIEEDDRKKIYIINLNRFLKYKLRRNHPLDHQSLCKNLSSNLILKNTSSLKRK